MKTAALDLFTKRRTQYALGRNLKHSPAEIEALVKEAVRLAPSSFNSQSSRVVILFGAASERLWDIVTEALRPVVPAADFAPSKAKMESFAAGAGTVLFYEDQDTVKGLQENFPLYADAFPVFSEHSAGMAQFAVWTALAEVGIGASLQHYQPLIDAAVAKEFGLPASWALRAQMPFGSNEAEIGPKTFIEDETRFRVFQGAEVAAE